MPVQASPANKMHLFEMYRVSVPERLQARTHWSGLHLCRWHAASSEPGMFPLLETHISTPLYEAISLRIDTHLENSTTVILLFKSTKVMNNLLNADLPHKICKRRQSFCVKTGLLVYCKIDAEAFRVCAVCSNFWILLKPRERIPVL